MKNIISQLEKNPDGFEFNLWGKSYSAIISIDDELYNHPNKSIFFTQIQEKIHWIEINRAVIIDTFVQHEKEGMEELLEEIAEQIAENGVAEDFAKDKNLEDVPIYNEISEQEFLEGLQIVFVSFVLDDESVICNFQLDTEPSFFSDHSPVFALNKHNELKFLGMDG